MAVYKVTELLDFLTDTISSGCDYVEISELEAEDDCPASLSLSPLSDECGEDFIDSCEEHDIDLSHISFQLDSKYYPLVFSFNEICTVEHALANVLEYFKECENSKTYTNEIKKAIKASSVKCRNLHAKIKKSISAFL